MTGRGYALEPRCRAPYAGSTEPGKAPCTRHTHPPKQYSWVLLHNDGAPPREAEHCKVHTACTKPAGRGGSRRRDDQQLLLLPSLPLSLCVCVSVCLCICHTSFCLRKFLRLCLFPLIATQQRPPWEEHEHSSSESEAVST